ncbi:Dam family site-specific DNA-(adenine-N6)-methyltransferase [Lignipirellula cremea]|uniref:site-specific DNA-methyltransferase (adenine-specific) n=1 Tax=Lignipirellula cremea TaxID=2528010 RepID=A0A518E0R2_9BACT|nr:Dam family site-specific DNA-(adenine-N6)-methyltransferase [Lignipirellula cremea]QDU97673.1 Modification methylase DpnIIB [Lignipirellula cremea]
MMGPFALDTVHHGDCLAALQQLPDRSVDLAIADPPYNLSKGGQWKWDPAAALPGFGGAWSKVMESWDNMPLVDYFRFTLAWLGELKRVVRPTGSLWIHGAYHNIGLINFALQLLEVEIINEVAWFKRNSFPNLSGRRLTASHETILWAHTGGAGNRQYYFDYLQSKAMACPEDGLKQAGKQLRTVWDIPNNKRREELQAGKHPTQKPERLIERMLAISAKPGDLLLSPFAGAGTDCVAAQRFGLHFLGFDTDAAYVDLCRRRLAASADRLADLPAKKTGETNGVARPPASSTSSPAGPFRARQAKSIPSLIKWTGGKRSQASRIAALLPPFGRYFEPFLGGGALLYLTATPGAVAGDAYPPLIDLWKLLRDEPQKVVAAYRRDWKKLTAELDRLGPQAAAKGERLPAHYYAVRDRFNRRPNPLDLNLLLRTCVNGIVRFNDQGEFNNSFHLSRRGMEPDRFAKVVEAWRPLLGQVDFVCQDYADTVAAAGAGDLVYFDPPYAGNRQRYTADLDLDRFFGVLADLNQRGVHWALSFDGSRGDKDLTHAVPPELYRQQLRLDTGASAVNKVLNGPLERVEESLYLNFEAQG